MDMKIGTRSILFGVHTFWLHPLFVWLAWIKLYGWTWNVRIIVAFFVHDLGYWGKPDLDGTEGETHPELGARLMNIWFDGPRRYDGPYLLPYDEANRRMREETGWEIDKHYEDDNHLFGKVFVRRHRPDLERHEWRDFCLYHSRFYAKRDEKPYSKLCVADKLAFCLEPWWFYLPRAILSGEIREYMRAYKGKYATEPRTTQETLDLRSPNMIQWHRGLVKYVTRWVEEHKDLRPDTWTPEQSDKSSQTSPQM
jgi:hypothetical protein